MDRFPNNVEAVAYGVVALGWIIGGVVRAIVRAIRRLPAKAPRIETETSAADRR